MILGDFHQHQTNNQNNRHKVKKQYSAGFRNYYPDRKNKNSDEGSVQNKSLDIFSQIGIINLKQEYQKILPKQSNKQRIDEQQKAIQRLYKVKKEIKQSEQNEIDVNNKQKQQRFRQVFLKRQDYQEKAYLLLFKKQYNTYKQILNNILNNKKPTLNFQKTIVSFIIQYQQKYYKKNKINLDQISLDFTNYLCNYNFHQNNSIQKSILQNIINKNIFFKGFFNDIQSLPINVDSENLQKCINNSQQKFISQQVIQLLNKNFTIPYDSHAAQNIQKSINTENTSKQSDIKYVFHANPIPKTTFQKPKERPKSAFQKTEPTPFNLTSKDAKIPKIQDYYKWDRAFKASQIPQTTYKQQKIMLLSEDDKKKRALGLLKQSKAPKTMEYLNNYKQYLDQKQNELSSKYCRNRLSQRQKIQFIPNFKQIHHKNMIQLEIKKQQNKKTTKPIPFNLSQPVYKQRVQYQRVYEPEIKQIKKQQKKINIIPKSTLKYEAQLALRKKQKQQKIKQQQQNLRKIKQKQNKTAHLTQLLKNRILDQVNNIKSQPQHTYKIDNNQVKVNLLKIYSEEPLLIQRQNGKRKYQKQQTTHNWKPII